MRVDDVEPQAGLRGVFKLSLVRVRTVVICAPDKYIHGHFLRCRFFLRTFPQTGSCGLALDNSRLMAARTSARKASRRQNIDRLSIIPLKKLRIYIVGASINAIMATVCIRSSLGRFTEATASSRMQTSNDRETRSLRYVSFLPSLIHFP